MMSIMYIPDYVTPDGTDQTAKIQAVLDMRPYGDRQVGITYDFGPGGYHCCAPLNLTERDAFTLRGGMYNSPAIRSHAVGRAAIDLVGARFYHIKDFYLWGDEKESPAAAFLSARTASHKNAGNASYVDVCLRGTFTEAAWYLIDTEVMFLDRCISVQMETPVVYWTVFKNDLALPSYAEIDDTMYDGTTVHRLSHLHFNTKKTLDNVAIRLTRSNNSQIRDSYWTVWGDGRGIEIAATGNALNNLVIEGCSQEGDAQTFLHLDEDAHVRNMRFANCGQDPLMIDAGEGSLIERSTIDNLVATDRDVCLKLYDVHHTTIRNWWVFHTAKIEAHDVKDSEIWLPSSGTLEVSGTLARTDVKGGEVV